MSAPIVVVINAKGGSGATTLSVETARQIRRNGSHVAIVDGDLSGRRTLSVLLDSVRQLDANRSIGVYSVIQTGGMTAVELTDTIDNAYALRVDEVDALVDKLVRQHDLVIVDTPTPFSSAVRPFVTRATRFVIVLEPNLLGTAAARTLIGDLQKFGVPLGRVWIVTNLRSGRAEITARELEKALGGTVVGEVPVKADRNYPRAIELLAKRFSEITSEAPLSQLRSSASVPIGSTASTPGGVSQNGQFEAKECRCRDTGAFPNGAFMQLSLEGAGEQGCR